MKNKILTMAIAFFFCLTFPAMAQTKPYKVLVIFSYEDTYPSTLEYKEGIEQVLKESSEIRYFHMDTKKNLKNGSQKSKEAYVLYQEFQPDGVIACDDNAQSMFVVPYLKDRVKTPVMFCGVNAEPKKYGYPCQNVSGILERLHINESIALVQQLAPSIKTIGYIMKESPTAKFVEWQINNESDSYSAKSVTIRMPKTLEETVAMTTELKKKCDLLYLIALQGITDKAGNSLSEKEIVSTVLKTFDKPTITGVAYNIKYGVLCAVIHKMQEQGETAAKMLLKSMQGKPVSEIPITRNQHGKLMINVNTLKTLGIKPDPMVLHTAELVRTEN